MLAAGVSPRWEWGNEPEPQSGDTNCDTVPKGQLYPISGIRDFFRRL
jgi:hypothetical protein